MANHRRNFLKAAGGLFAAAGIGVSQLRGEQKETAGETAISAKDYRPPLKELGATGLSCSLLGVGTGTNGWGGRSNQTELGRKQLVSLLEYCAGRGVTYFDLADQYGSHEYMRAALKEGGGSIEREKAFILTKTHARDADGMRRDLDRFRKEIGTDVLDVVLLHCKFSADWPETHAGAMEALSEAKEKGIVRAHGVSCHSLQALRAAAKEPWVEVDLARLNPWGANMDSDVETVKGVLRSMRREKKGIIGMKILAAGRVQSVNDVKQGVHHAVTCGLMDTFTIGVSSRDELDELLKLLSEIPA